MPNHIHGIIIINKRTGASPVPTISNIIGSFKSKTSVEYLRYINDENEYGRIANEEWQNIQRLRENIKLDKYIIMPNHIHGIIIVHNSDMARNITDTARRVSTGRFGKSVAGSLSTIIRSFKSAVIKRINELCQTTISPVWQSSFYDYVIRTHDSLNNIREYIINNPATWDDDERNPNN